MASTIPWLRLLPWLTAALPFVFVAVRGFPAGDDWQLELARIAQYLEALRDAQWPPFWAPSLYAGHGSPLFLFYGHTFLALSGAAALAAGSCGLGYLLALAAASACGVVWTQRLGAAWVRGTAEDNARGGRIAAYLYLASPYLLADMLLRNAAAEFTALCCLPLALYGCLAVARAQRGGVLVLAAAAALVLVSHVLVALMLCVLLLLLGAALMITPRPLLESSSEEGEQRPQLRSRAALVRQLVCAGLLGLALAAFHALPLAVYRSWLDASELVRGKFEYAAQLGSLARVFDPGAAHAAGLLPLVIAVAAVPALWRRALAPRALNAALLAGVCLFSLLQTPLARPFLAALPWLAYLQFPFRCNGPLALCAALLGSGLLSPLMAARSARSKALLELGVWLVCVLATWPQLARTSTLSWSEVARFEALLEPAQMRRTLVTATVLDEYLPYGARRSAVRAPAQAEPVLSARAHVGIAGAAARLAIRGDEPRRLSLVLRTEQPTELCLARWGFAFWDVEVDDQPQPPGHCADGHLRVLVPAGKHQVVASLRAPPLRRLGVLLSLVTGCTMLLVSRFRKRTRRSTR